MTATNLWNFGCVHSEWPRNQNQNNPLSQTVRLQRVHNNAAMLITRSSKHDHIIPVLKELHWLPVESRSAFKMLVITLKCINGLVLSYHAELVQLRHCDRRLRQKYAPKLAMAMECITCEHSCVYGTLSNFRKCLKHIFVLDISINSNCFEMTDTALEFLFSVIHVLISVYVLD